MNNNDFNQKPDYAVCPTGVDRRFPNVAMTSGFMLIILVGFFAVQTILVALLDFFGLVNAFSENATFYYLTNSIFELAYLGIPILFMVLYYKQDRTYFLRLNPMKASEILITVLIGGLVYVANSLLTEANVIAASFISEIEIPSSPDLKSVSDRIFFMITLVVVAPVTEEFVMRGIMLRGFEGKSKRFACIITGVFFGMLHLSYYTIIPKILVGILLCYVVYTTNSIYAGIIVHMINNAIGGLLSIAVQPYAEETVEQVAINDIEAIDRLVMLVMCVMVSIGLIFVIIALVAGLRNIGKKAGADGIYVYKGAIREKLPSEHKIKWYCYLPIVITFVLLTAYMAGDCFQHLLK